MCVFLLAFTRAYKYYVQSMLLCTPLGVRPYIRHMSRILQVPTVRDVPTLKRPEILALCRNKGLRFRVQGLGIGLGILNPVLG